MISNRYLKDRLSDERGAVAVIVAITLSVLVLMAAFVIDLGLARVDSGQDQLVSDMAAAAGANELNITGEEWNAAAACETALAFAVSNLGGTGSPSPTACRSPCARGWLPRAPHGDVRGTGSVPSTGYHTSSRP